MAIDVRKFVYENITPYDGDASFLAGPTERTNELMEEVKKFLKEERDNN
jgi:formate C-acetyltransferase